MLIACYHRIFSPICFETYATRELRIDSLQVDPEQISISDFLSMLTRPSLTSSIPSMLAQATTSTFLIYFSTKWVGANLKRINRVTFSLYVTLGFSEVESKWLTIGQGVTVFLTTIASLIFARCTSSTLSSRTITLFSLTSVLIVLILITASITFLSHLFHWVSFSYYRALLLYHLIILSFHPNSEPVLDCCLVPPAPSGCLCQLLPHTLACHTQPFPRAFKVQNNIFVVNTHSCKT